MALAAVVVGAAFMWLPFAEAAGRTVSRSVPSDFFEDAAPPPARSSPEGAPAAGAPFDVGNDAVPLPNEFESAHAWSLPEDASPAARPRPGPLSLVSAQSSTITAPAREDSGRSSASSTRSKQEEVNEDAAPRSNRQTQPAQSQLQEQEALLRQRDQAMQQELAELQRQQQLQLQALQREEAQTKQPATQQPQRTLQPQQQQQQQAQRLQQQLLQMAQLQGQKQTLQQQERQPAQTSLLQSPSAPADAAAEAANFFEEQGDLGGRDPLSLSALEVSPSASAHSQRVDSGQAAPQAAREEQQDRSSMNPNMALLTAQSGPLSRQQQQPQQAPPLPPMPQLRGSTDDQVRKIRQEQLYLQNLQQSLQQALMQNTSRPQLLPGAAPQSLVGDIDFMPKHEDCTPRCSYKCTNPSCEEECEPQCDSPKCQTRCSGMELSGCRMQCGQPHCSVICPSKMCSGKDCQQCSAKCSEPMCMLQCPKAQPCHNVCEQPRCEWKCKAPTSCPKPKCDMVCESPQSCAGTTHKELPPLKPGELSVLSFKAPAEFAAAAQLKADTAVKSQTPAPQQRVGSFMEMGASSLRGGLTGLRGDYPGLQSALHVPVESLPEGGAASRFAWPSALGQASPQTQQWTARMPATQGWEDPLKGYYTKDLAAAGGDMAA